MLSDIVILLYGRKGADAALGLNALMGVTDNQISEFLKKHEEAIVQEFGAHGVSSDKKNLRAVLRGTKRAGWDSGASIAELMAHKCAVVARLEKHHVIALRLYLLRPTNQQGHGLPLLPSRCVQLMVRAL